METVLLVRSAASMAGHSLALALALGLAVAGAHRVGAQPAGLRDAASERAPNILLIIGDDMGIETLASFGVGAQPAATPTLDRLAAAGVRFNNFWSQPVCSPTRATLLTGRYGFRTGVGRAMGGDFAGPMPETPPKPIDAPAEGRRDQARGRGPQARPPGGPGLRSQEFTLPKAFAAHRDLGYATAAIGKWHLADRSNGWEKHPNLVGFDHFAGLMGGFPEGYFAWIKVVNGAFSGRTGYAPTDKVDDAIRWIEDRGDQPWFLWLAFNLAHAPLHLPPKHLWVRDHSDLDASADPNANPDPYFAAMMEAMDTEIGRLLDSLEPSVRANTYVIFMGDNGTSQNVIGEPFSRNHGKGTVYEGGVNVPLMVSGPGVVAGGASDALVNSTDMFTTIMEMAKIDPRTTVPKDVVIDSVSFLPYLSAPNAPSIRKWLYADVFDAGEPVARGQYAIRNDRYKLVVSNGQEELFDVIADRSETTNLLAGTLTPAQREAHTSLRTEVDALHASEKAN